MARKKEISYFTDINSDEELEKFLEQDALISEKKTFIYFYSIFFN